MHERARDMLLGAWGRFVAGRPRLTIAICLALAAGSIALTAAKLEFRPDRSDLVDPELPWNKRYADYKARFPSWSDVIIVLEGPADDAAITSLARSIAENLADQDRVADADAGFQISQAGPKFFRVGPPDEFERAIAQIGEAKRLAAAGNANEALATLLSRLRSDGEQNGSLSELSQFLEPYLTGVSGEPADFSFLQPAQADQWVPLESESGRLRFIPVQFGQRSQRNGVNSLSGDLAWLRSHVGSLIADASVDVPAWGVTGIPAIESDETAQSTRDSLVASILAFVLITALLFAVFRGVTVPLLAGGSLLIGIAWSFGWLILSVGHLQVLSVVFTVMLLGLGIDFAVLLVSRLELVQNEHPDLASATSRVFRGVGPGMISGAITTCAAFASTAFTQFTGMAEMGIIAAGGIVLCLIAVLSAFPAAIAIVGNWKSYIRHRRGGETAHFAHGWLDAADARPWSTLALGLVLVGLFSIGAAKVSYDPNVLNLQSAGVESVHWENRITTEDARTTWSALVVAPPDLNEVGSLADQLSALQTVSGVGGMGMLTPPDRAERRRQIAELRDARIAQTNAQPSFDTTITMLGQVAFGLQNALGDVTDPDARRAMTDLVRRIQGIGVAAQSIATDAKAQRFDRLNSAFIATRDELRGWIEAALAPEPIAPADLPPTLREMWVGTDGSWLLRIYPMSPPLEESILDPQHLGPFVESVLAVAPSALGPPVQIYESTRIIVRAYTLAACYAIAAILIILLLDFRSLADTLCAMAPVVVGFIGAFGIMGVAGVPLNFANIIVMPLIFGIGVAAGVHIVHRWRAEPHGRPAGLSGGTGRGITLTMTTTMIGFGCMLTAQHRGIRSLGIVMVAGLAVTLLACYTILPAILALRGRLSANRGEPASVSSASVTEAKSDAGARREYQRI